MHMSKKIAMLTGGGDCPGLNPVIRAITRKGLQLGYEIIGIKNGWKGMINRDTIPLDRNAVAGIINGLGHWWGYRNFEASDASTNVSPWGIIIGGEELHNNHHTYPTSAKLSVKKYEFDIGWGYIRALEMMGLAKVRKTPPQLKLGSIKPVADSKTLEALIANADYLQKPYRSETLIAKIEALLAGGDPSENIETPRELAEV